MYNNKLSPLFRHKLEMFPLHYIADARRAISGDS